MCGTVNVGSVSQFLFARLTKQLMISGLILDCLFGSAVYASVFVCLIYKSF